MRLDGGSESAASACALWALWRAAVGRMRPDWRSLQVVSHDKVASRESLPALCFLQGGPGFESPRPTEASGWLKSAAAEHRVVLLDQRGTGRSAAITVQQLARDFPGDAAAQAAYVARFRADAIVDDAEALRRALLGEGSKWSTLGQSYGGFCTCVYLSKYPSSLSACYVTGGLPPVDAGCTARAVYTALFHRVRRQCDKFYARFPHHEGTVQRVVGHLVSKGGSVPLPGGGVLSVRGFQMLGLKLGSQPGIESFSYMLETAFDGDDELSYAFLRAFETFVPFCINPLYYLLHETIYCSGPGEASSWACQAVLDEDPETSRLHDAAARAAAGERVYLTGEMVFPYMLAELPALQPLKEVAEYLARKEDWEQLYDEEALARNEVPVAACAYTEDMYVEHDLSQETATKIKGLRLMSTSEYQHNGLRMDVRIFDRLRAMASNEVPLF